MSDVNWAGYAQMYNPGAGISAGLTALDSSFDKIRQRQLEDIALKRQSALDELTMGLQRQKLQMGDMELADAQRKQDNFAKLMEFNKTLDKGKANPAMRQQLDAYTPEALALDQGRMASVTMGEDGNLQPNPAFAQAKAQLDFASAPTVQETVPFTNNERTQQTAQFMNSRGMYDEMDKLGKYEDITSKISDRQQKEFMSILTAVERGFPPSVIAAQAAQQGHPQPIVEALRTMKYNPTAKVAFMDAPNGATIAVGTGKDGQVTIHQVSDPKNTDAGLYKQRTRPDGRQEIFEESLDGGKTWKELSRGTKDNPNSVRPSITIIPGAFDSEGQPLVMDRKTGQYRAATAAPGQKMDVATAKNDYKADTQSTANQVKQKDMMGSFVKNMEKQVDRVEDLSKKISTFDTRLLNLPLNQLKSRVMGNADLAKYQMYITEIESEIGKIASGSAASVAELSQGAREKWERIHDKNLSVKDMLALLKETSHAGKMRMDSINEQIKETKGRVGKGGAKPPAPGKRKPLSSY